MIPSEVYRMYDILTSFLGESKSGLDESYQLQFLCPNCVKNKGREGRTRFNLEVSLNKNIFNCWSCAAEGENMHGTVFKLIRKFGTNELLRDYKDCIDSIRNNKLYELSPEFKDFSQIVDNESMVESISLPDGYHRILNGEGPTEVIEYLVSRGITRDIIDKFKIGYIPDSFSSKMMRNRIVLPSYGSDGYVNYWTARDFRNESWRPKYRNPKVERNSIIFNESNINWDSDITLVEGPFDCLVYPNMVPLLGKKITSEFKLYEALMTKARANVNIFLDGDAYDAAKELYRLLNTGPLNGRIRYIPVDSELDPSEIFQKQGRAGVINHIRQATKINELYLLT